jgi:hypothetical protein
VGSSPVPPPVGLDLKRKKAAAAPTNKSTRTPPSSIGALLFGFACGAIEAPMLTAGSGTIGAAS